MSNAKLLEYAKEMRKLQDIKEQLSEELKNINIRLDELRLKLIPDLMAEEDIRNITFEGIGRVQLAFDVYASIKDKEKGYEWLRESGYEDVIKPYIQPSTFTALVKEAMKKGESFPEEIFNISPFVRASIVKKV